MLKTLYQKLDFWGAVRDISYPITCAALNKAYMYAHTTAYVLVLTLLDS